MSGFIFAFLVGSVISQNLVPGKWPQPDAIPPADPAIVARYPEVPQKMLAPVKTCNETAHWALTFDDGPTDQTLRVLDILDRLKLKATFFVVGSRVLTNPDILKKTYEKGHQIALHTWSHTPLTVMTDDQIITDLEYNIKIIKEVIGVSPKLMRPPQGEIDARVEKVLSRMGLVPVMWSKDSQDWRIQQYGPQYAPRVIEQVKSWATSISGEISLHHDLFEGPVNHAEEILETIKSFNVDIVPVGKCLRAEWYREFTPKDSHATAGFSVSAIAVSIALAFISIFAF